MNKARKVLAGLMIGVATFGIFVLLVDPFSWSGAGPEYGFLAWYFLAVLVLLYVPFSLILALLVLVSRQP